MARKPITDEMWSKIEPLLPEVKDRPANDNRTFIEAVLWLLRTGAQWRDLPPEFGPWKTTYNRFNNWAKKGHFLAALNLFQ